MYVCMYVCMYVYKHDIYIYIHIYIYRCNVTHMCICIHMYICTHLTFRKLLRLNPTVVARLSFCLPGDESQHTSLTTLCMHSCIICYLVHGPLR